MSALERLKFAAAHADVFGASGVYASDLRELITSAESREVALHAETERGNALAVRVVELEAIHDTLRAKLVGAQSQAAAACREVFQLRAQLREMES